VGNYEKAAAAALVMKDFQIEILDVSHFVNVEGAKEVNRGIASFLNGE
jgi:hypothetical protein